MKKTIFFLTLFFWIILVCGQTHRIDSLRKKLADATDTLRPFLLNKIAEGINDSISVWPLSQKDSLLNMAKNCVTEAEALSRKLNYNRGIGLALFLSGAIKADVALSNLDKAIIDYKNALPYLKISNDLETRAYCFNSIALGSHFIGKLDSSIIYHDSAISCFLQLRDSVSATQCMIWQGHDYFDKGDYKNAYLFGARALNAAQKTGDTSLIVFANIQFEDLFLNAGLPERTIDYLHTVIKLHPLTAPQNGKTTLSGFMQWAVWAGGDAYIRVNKIDSAIYLSQFVPEDSMDGDNYRFYGQIYAAQHRDDKAMENFVKGFEVKKRQGHSIGIAGTAVELGQIYLKKNDYKSAIHYAQYGLTIAKKIHALLEMRDAVGVLSDAYAQTGNYKEAYNYTQQYKKLNDSLASEEDRKKLSLDLIQTELDAQKQKASLLSKENQLKQQQLHNETLLRNFFIAGAIIFLLIAIIIFRNYRQKQKANNLLEQQKKKIEHTLSELKSTQAQLIQSEKMASLGELTAGIAHEIQNPLNFVNNFSEVSNELIEELNAERRKPNVERDEQTEQDILNDIKQNLEKINHHGKRAGDIVRGMLQHSRTSTGQKELTDINTLCDEYLRLAYHGFRAKDKSFNAEMKTDFDENIGNVNIVPQDIGRVILNLINNAFYAASLSSPGKIGTNSGGTSGSGSEKNPTVWVSTKKEGDKILISVRDNGPGIPQNILDKIFQPFFTTKPTGQGTGLGLSLSYDIITKGHGGELKVETKEGEGSEFIISLPF